MTNIKTIFEVCHPNTKAIVDFIDDNFCVEIKLDGMEVHIKIKAFSNPNDSTWKEDDMFFVLPERDDDEDDGVIIY